MTKFILKESPNPDFVYIVTDDAPNEKRIGFSKEELTSPLSISHNLEITRPPDSRIVRLLKIGAAITDESYHHVPTSGFDDWEECRDWLVTISDVTPLLTGQGLTVDKALTHD